MPHVMLALGASLLIFISGYSSAQTQALPISEKIVSGRLDNGLTYFIKTNQKPLQRAELRLVVKAGSLYEDNDQLGFAHFVEHMAFNGTQDFAKQSIIDFMESIGMRFGAHLNAYTSFNETVYQLTLPTDQPEQIETGFHILQNWAHKISFEGEEIDKERGVVLEEWRRRQSAGQRIFDQQVPVIFKGSRYATRLPIGTPDIIQNGTHDNLKRYYDTWYRPDLMAIVAVGDLDIDKTKALITRYFSTIKKPENPANTQDYSVPLNEEPLVSIATDPELTGIQASFSIRKPASPAKNTDDLRRGVIYGLFTGMLNARISEAVQQGTLPVVSTGVGYGRFVEGINQWSLQVTPKPDQIISGFEESFNILQQAVTLGFLPAELARQKATYLALMQRSAKEVENQYSASFARQIVSHIVNQTPLMSIEQQLALMQTFLDTISLQEVNKLGEEWLSPAGRIITLSAPQGDKANLPNEQTLLSIWQQAQTKEAKAYEEKGLEDSLLTSLPKPGSIVKREYKEALNTHVWTLSNGARAWLKPTEFRNDEILMGSYSYGGRSTLKDEDVAQMRMTTSIVSQLGFGSMDQSQLRKFNAGKAYSLSAAIGLVDEHIRGRTTVADLDIALQAMHAMHAQPRRDKAAFDTFISRAAPGITQRMNSPNWAFSEAIRQAQYKNSPRSSAITLDLLYRLDMDKNVQFYRQRFGNAADFDFFFVGNINLEQMEGLIEKYIASLPSTGEKETWVKHKSYARTGEFDVEVKKGQADKATVILELFGDDDWSQQNNLVFNALASNLRTRLRETLREDKGGVYGVGVSASFNRIPHEKWGITISFSCDPQRTQELIDDVYGVFEQMKAAPLDEKYINNFVEQSKKSRELALEENSFWISHLHGYAKADIQPVTIEEFEPMLATLNAKVVHQAAKRYFSSKNKMRAVLLPEEEPSSDNVQ